MVGAAGATTQPKKGTKKTKKVVKRVVRKVAVTHAFQNQALTGSSSLMASAAQMPSLQSTPDASNQRLKMSQTATNLKVS